VPALIAKKLLAREKLTAAERDLLDL
jgi:hypothetical protein